MKIVDNVRPKYNLLDKNHCETIHLMSLEILRRTGVRVYHDEALNLLRQADVSITDDNLVRFQPGLVEWALTKPPSRIPLCRRAGNEVIAPLEGREVCFGSGSDCLTYLDPRTGERRPWTKADLVDTIRVVDAAPELQFCMSMGIPTDLIRDKPYLEQFVLMIENTSKPIVFVCDDRADCEAIIAMATAASGSIEELRLNPFLLLYTEPSSPLRHSKTATEKLLFMAEQQLPIVHSPAPVQGGTAPVTLAGALAQANAEILSGLVIHQLKRAGAPFVYGSGMHHLDMKSTISVYTCPEFVLARVVVAEMGRYYRLPTWGYAGDSNSCVVDEQAAAEATFSIMAAYLAGNNLTHDIGYLESGRTTSPEMIILCDEIISMLRKFMNGINFDENSFAMDAIHEVGPDGNFLASHHTVDNFRNLWRPSFFSRLGGEAWSRSGSKRTSESLREKTLDIIDNHQSETLQDNVIEEIHHILKTA
jgi:trimethylamine--corrinoid protein Co-methyltransferase